jgi:hypothetical protein
MNKASPKARRAPGQPLTIIDESAPFPHYLYERVYEERRKRAIAATAAQALDRVVDLIENGWTKAEAVAYVRDSGIYSEAAREAINAGLKDIPE